MTYWFRFCAYLECVVDLKIYFITFLNRNGVGHFMCLMQRDDLQLQTGEVKFILKKNRKFSNIYEYWIWREFSRCSVFFYS